LTTRQDGLEIPQMTYISERRHEERERRREEIVDAAESVYADVGWDSLTMDKVARNARLSRALLYVYFEDKDDLHLAIVERAMLILRQRMDAAAAERLLGIDKLEAIGRAYVAFSVDLPHLFDACVRFKAHHTDAGDTNARTVGCRAAGHYVHESVVAALRSGIDDGSIRNDLADLNATAITAWAFAHGVIQIAATKSGQIAYDGSSVAAVTEHAFGLMRSALQPIQARA
jgi:AcrR family transcriptional regulator